MESTSSEYARFLAYGNQLIEIHIGLRDLLADLREGIVPAAELHGEQPVARVAALQQELDALAAVLETHFIGEEKRLVGVLNAVDPAEGLTGLTA